MDPLATEQLDDLLPNGSQPNATSRHLGMLRQHAEDVSLRWICIHTQKQIRSRQVEKTERVGLHDLREIHDPAQFDGCRRNAYC